MDIHVVHTDDTDIYKQWWSILFYPFSKKKKSPPSTSHGEKKEDISTSHLFIRMITSLLASHPQKDIFTYTHTHSDFIWLKYKTKVIQCEILYR